MINLDMFEDDKNKLESQIKCNELRDKLNAIPKDELLCDQMMFHVSTKEVRRVK